MKMFPITIAIFWIAAAAHGEGEAISTSQFLATAGVPESFRKSFQEVGVNNWKAWNLSERYSALGLTVYRLDRVDSFYKNRVLSYSYLVGRKDRANLIVLHPESEISRILLGLSKFDFTNQEAAAHFARLVGEITVPQSTFYDEICEAMIKYAEPSATQREKLRDFWKLKVISSNGRQESISFSVFDEEGIGFNIQVNLEPGEHRGKTTIARRADLGAFKLR